MPWGPRPGPGSRGPLPACARAAAAFLIFAAGLWLGVERGSVPGPAPAAAVVAAGPTVPANTATIRTIVGGQSDLGYEELVAAIRQEVRRLDLRGDAKGDADAYLAQMDRPYFIVLPPPLPDEALLAGLQQRDPRVTFITQAESLTSSSVRLPERIMRSPSDRPDTSTR